MRFTYKSLLKVIAFCAATGLLIAAVGVTFGKVRLEDATTYRAEFTDASGLRSGADVRGAGVSIGRVTDLERREGGGIVVTFTAASDINLTSSTKAQIRYANLTGDRYLDLTPGTGGSPLAADGRIPLANTKPALELDDFFAGFDPLMRALDPNEINQLAQNVIAVTDGQAGSIEQMLANIGRFTNGLAERDQLIGDVIVNLTDALVVIDDNRGAVDQLIVGVDDLMSDLAKDRKSIGRSIAGIANLSSEMAALLVKTRPGIQLHLRNIGTVARNLRSQEPVMRDILGDLVSAAHQAARLGTYGSFFGFYLCSVQVRVLAEDDPDGTDSGIYSPLVASKDDRCQLPKEER